MKHFYAVLDGRRGQPKFYIENILISAASLWWKSRNKFVHRTPPPHKRFFLDSGGFSFFIRKGDYPYTTEEYLKLIRYYKPTYAAVMDYPCEPELPLGDVRSRIDRTIANTKELLSVCVVHPTKKMNPPSFFSCADHRTEIIPVIQGYDLEDYKYCIDRMRTMDLIRPYMAVGSMCRRVSIKELRTLVVAISDYVGAVNQNIKLHFFGLKKSALKDFAICERVYSCDSMAYKLNPTGKMYPPSSETYRLLKAYTESIYELKLRNERQKRLTCEYL